MANECLNPFQSTPCQIRAEIFYKHFHKTLVENKSNKQWQPQRRGPQCHRN